MVRVVLAALVLVFVVLVFMAASSCGGAGNRATWYAQVTAPPRLAWVLLVLFPSQGQVASRGRPCSRCRSARGTHEDLWHCPLIRLRWPDGCARGCGDESPEV